MSTVVLALLTACLTLAGVGGADAQTYPSRPVTMIVPFPAGGATDSLGRLLGERLRPALGQPVVIENVAGAAGSLGVGRAVRAAADGYTMLIGTLTTNVLIGGLYALTFDLLKDLEPIAQLGAEPLLIVGRKDLPAQSLKELIAWLKANPDKASAGVPGVGATGHLTGISFQRETGTRFQFVPYRGNAPAMQDLVAGQIDVMIEPASNFQSLVRAGSIKAFAVTAPARVAAMPDIPTVDEAGLAGFHSSLWYGLWVPKNTAKDVIARLNAAALETLADPAIKQRFDELGIAVPARAQQTPEGLRAFQKAEADKWWPIIKAANIKGQ